MDGRISSRVSYFEISRSHVLNLLELAKVRNTDIFLELGSGSGLAVCLAVSEKGVKKSVGVEKNYHLFESAKINSIHALNRSQLEKTEFWLGDINNQDWSYDDDNYVFNYERATVVYQSLMECAGDIRFYRKRFRRHFKLITKDLPLIGYRPEAVSRKNDDCWFFLTRFPAKRVRSKELWCYYVLGERGKCLRDVYAYYRKQLRRHFRNDQNLEELVEGSVRPVRYLAELRFG
ncbi:MAG: hypothetical protein ACREAN_06295 [Nitrosopumilaceae archaeon]